MSRAGAPLGLAVLAFVAGAVTVRSGLYQRLREPMAEAQAAERRVAERTPVPLDSVRRFPSGRVAILLALGQSNAANRGGHPAPPRGRVYNWHAGQLYVAHDPLLGGSDDRGSIWMRLADTLLARGEADAVVLAVVAEGGVPIAQWAEGSALDRRMRAAAHGLVAAGLSPTAVLWLQGETDAGQHTGPDQYAAALTQLVGRLRTEGIRAPLIVSLATRCQDIGPDASIRAAQRTVATTTPGVALGPDLDSLGLAYRFDGCHFTDDGLATAAGRWAAAIRSR